MTNAKKHTGIKKILVLILDLHQSMKEKEADKVKNEI